MTDTTTAAPAAPAPRVTPTVSQSIRVDWGSWLAQLLDHEKAVIESAASGGATLALSAIPFGSFVANFVGPTIIKQYVDMGLVALEGVVNPMSLDVPATNTLFTTVANLINANEPSLAAFLGGQIDPMIKAAIGKLGVAV